MILAVVAALAMGSAPDPCAPPPAAPPAPDPEAAAQYREVGDSERRTGSRDTATAAYRAALSHDPADVRSRRALEELCSEEERDGAYQQGIRLMNGGDRRGAVAQFERARAGGRDTSAALLEGICLYELGEDRRADGLLAEAELDPEHREAARFFRGLVALRAGEGERAATLLEASAADRSLGSMALDLAREARREGRLVLSVAGDSGWDSNVDLTPSGAPQSSDGSAGLTAFLRWAPTGDTGPYLRATGFYRDQFRYNALDMSGAGAAAGLQAGRGRHFAAAEAGYELRTLGASPYLSAPRVLGTARLAFDGGASVGATYYARWETFLPSLYAPYSGLHHLAEIDVTWRVARRSTVTLAWQIGRDAVKDSAYPWLSWWENGPRAAVRFAISSVVRAGVEASWASRRYDAPYPGFGQARSDEYLDGSAFVDWDVGDRWTLRTSLAGRRALSNQPGYEYDKLVPTLGIAYAAGIL